jgi:hypothetical protein
MAAGPDVGRLDRPGSTTRGADQPEWHLMEASLARIRAASEGERDVKEDFDALRSDLDTLREDFGAFLAEMEAGMARATLNGGRAAKEDFGTPRSDLGTLRSDFDTFLSTLKDNASSRTQAEVDAMRQRVATLASHLQATSSKCKR